MAAALTVVAAAAWWWWQSTATRILTVSIFPDYAYRQRPGWKALLESRMAEVSRIYEQQTGVRWKVASIESEDPINGSSAPLDARRAELSYNHSSPADILLIVTGVHEGGRPGSVSPFSHAALVVDFPERSELWNRLSMAHELAHLFGVLHEPGTSTLMAPEPNDTRFSTRAATLIRRLRHYPFREGTAALDGAWNERVLQALTDAGLGLYPNSISQARQAMAAALAIDGHYAPAIRHLREAVKVDPASAPARMELALTLMQDTQPDAAITVLREAIRAIPNNSRMHGILASLLSGKDREEAREEYQTAIRMDPGSADLYEALGSLLTAEGGRIDEAIAAYQDALRLNPELRRAQQGLDRARAIKEQALAEAAQLSLQAEAARTDWNAYYRLGLAQTRGGDCSAAGKSFAKAIALNPRFGAAHSGMAVMDYLRGDYAAALAEVASAKALGIEPSMSFLAAIKRRTGQP
jgi:tetratricopeptide (TPR) repeat protein